MRAEIRLVATLAPSGSVVISQSKIEMEVIFPLWLKIAFTLFVSMLVVVYWFKYGWANFLWFSDIALFLTVPALWLESSLLASMTALSVTLLEVAWNIDFFCKLGTGRHFLGLSKYMFDGSIPLSVRALSLFHIALPPLLVWMVYRLGYNERALPAQTVLACVVLLVTYWFTKPSENINWVRGIGDRPQTAIPAPVYLLLQIIVLTVLIYLPTHLAFKQLLSNTTR